MNAYIEFIRATVQGFDPSEDQMNALLVEADAWEEKGYTGTAWCHRRIVTYWQTKPAEARECFHSKEFRHIHGSYVAYHDRNNHGSDCDCF